MNRAGEYITNMSGDAAYKSFRPSALPPMPPLDLKSDITRLLIEANAWLAKLNSAAVHMR